MVSIALQGSIARSFALEFGVDVYKWIGYTADVIPRVVAQGKSGRPAIHIHDKAGADYYAARVDYTGNDDTVVTSLNISAVMRGYRTKLAYLPAGAQPKVLSVHRGRGFLIVGKPVAQVESQEPDDDYDPFDADIFPIDPSVTPQVVIQPGSFYTFQAASWSTKPLVVSELSNPARNQSRRREAEVYFQPGQTRLRTPDGNVAVPYEFVTADFA